MNNISNFFALKANGELWMCGMGLANGSGSWLDISSPVQVIGNHSFIWADVASNIYSVTSGHGLKSNGQIWSWGTNSFGELGQGNKTSYNSPVQVIGNHSFTKITVSDGTILALKYDGQIWSWGRNDYGQMGVDNVTPYSSPVQVVGNHSFTKVYSGVLSSFAIKDNGEAWAWGFNNNGAQYYGNLGTGTTNNYSSPVKVIGDHSFIHISSAATYTLFLKANGQCWSCGYNDYGSLGTGDHTWTSSPVQVIGNHSFINVATNYPGSSFGLKSNGEIWSWGLNTFGELGVGNTTSYSSPVQVIGNHSFIAIKGGRNCAWALKANGEVWAWGCNSNYQLGTGNLTHYSSPVLTIGNHSFTRLNTGLSLSVSVEESWKKRGTGFICIKSSGYKFKITIDKTKVNGSLTNYAFLFTDSISNIPSTFWDHVIDSNGLDIRFFDTDNIELKRDIVVFDSTNHKMEIWVQIPSLSSAANKEIYCTYGSYTRANDTSMWSDINAKVVLHFAGTDGSTTITDLSGKSWTAHGNAQIDTDQKKFASGSLYNTNAVNSWISTPDNDDFYTSTLDHAICFWINTTQTTTAAIFYQGDSEGTTSTVARIIDLNNGAPNAGKLRWHPDYTAYPSHHILGSSINVNDGSWHQICCIRVSNVWTLFVDGISRSTYTFSYTSINSTYDVVIGYLSNSYPNPFNGNIDEFRFFKGTAITEDWVKTDYNNQNDPSTFASCDTETLIDSWKKIKRIFTLKSNEWKSTDNYNL